MLYDVEVLNESDYKKECAKLLIAFENLHYKQENTIHIAKNVTIGYGLDLLKCYGQPKDFLLEYLPDDSKKLKIGNEELTFYGIIEKYRANKTGFTDPKVVKGYLQNKIFNFSLTQEQAQEVLENMIPKYEERLSAITTNYLPYSKERASLLSMRYLGKAIESNGLIKAIRDNSRFLSWFIIRYKTNVNTYLGYIARSSDEADIYLSNPNINQLKLIFDIFSCLNTKKETIDYRQYEYGKSTKHYTSHKKKDVLLKLAQWYENDLDFIKFDSQNQVSKITKSNISNIISQLTKKPINDITTTLKSHLDYLNTLTQKTFSLENIYCIQSFYGNLGSKKLTNVASINKILSQRFSNSPKQPQPTQDLHTNPQTNNAQINPNERILATTQDSTTQTNLAQTTPLQDNTQSRLSQTNHTDNPIAQERAVNPAQSTNENLTQILILYPTPTPLPIQIIQPQNTFLTLVLGKNAKLDCSKLIVGQCAILYLEYDEKEKESTQNPKLTALKSDAILTLNTQDSITYETSHNNILYTISKNDGVLRVSLQGNHKPNQDQEEIQENQETTQSNAIELYNFAKENEYRILKDSPSQMLDIQLKLQDNKELDTSHNGNFSLTINNLTLLDSKGKNLDITTKQDFTLYLHNCENRQVYTSTTITKNPNSDTYSTTFHFDLILEQTSNLFKRTTKLIVATQNLANDFSTSEIHSKGNVAIISLRSADKKGGSYTFGKLVSAQEFESQAIHTRNQYLASNDDALAYEVAFGEKADTIQIFNKEGIYLFSIERKDRTETKLNTKELYDIGGIQWFESGAENYHKLIDVNPDLKDKEKCEGLGVLYFTWREVVEFAHENNGDLHWYDILFMTSMSNKLNYARNMPYDWKQSPKGANGFILVSMEGIPYWADAVGQIPYAIGVYRNALQDISISLGSAKQKVIDNKYDFYDGSVLKGLLRKMGILSIPQDELADNYDNKMVDRGLKFAQRKYMRNKKVYPTQYEWVIVDLKPDPSFLALDSDGKVIYE